MALEKADERCLNKHVDASVIRTAVSVKQEGRLEHSVDIGLLQCLGQLCHMMQGR